MVNIKSVVDSTMGKIVKDGPKKPGANEDIKAFYDAVLQNEQFQNGILNTMQESAQKYAGIAMSGIEGEDLKEMLLKVSIAKPILSMMYAGYLVGKAAQEAEALDRMYGLDEVEKAN